MRDANNILDIAALQPDYMGLSSIGNRKGMWERFFNS